MRIEAEVSGVRWLSVVRAVERVVCDVYIDLSILCRTLLIRLAFFYAVLQEQCKDR